jgi:hypothetical protein
MIFSTIGYAWPDKWTAQDTVLEIGVESMLLLEWHQTNYGQKIKTRYYDMTINGNQYQLKEERQQICINPFLNEHPTKKQITTYFISTMIIHPCITYILPAKIRPFWQMTSIFFETNIIAKNYNIQGGWHLDF